MQITTDTHNFTFQKFYLIFVPQKYTYPSRLVTRVVILVQVYNLLNCWCYYSLRIPNFRSPTAKEPHATHPLRGQTFAGSFVLGLRATSNMYDVPRREY
jgi:hypothetical protein